MTDEQKKRYEAIKKLVEEELDHIDKTLSDEVTRARQRIEELQRAKKVVKEIYESLCTLLGAQSVVEMKSRGLGDEEKNS